MQDRFQTMSDQILNRIDEMGNRVDDLERNLNELMTNAGLPNPPTDDDGAQEDASQGEKASK